MKNDRASILIVDDEVRNIRVMEGILAPYEYDLLTADNGQDGLDKAFKNLPDLVLLDVMMPGLSGFDVCSRLKTDETTQFIPIVLVTALDDRNSRVTGIEAGADDFITKPVDATELRARVKSLLRIKKLHDQLQIRNRALERLESMRQTLVDMIIHDFTSPTDGVISHVHQVASHLKRVMQCRSVAIFLQSPRDGSFRIAAHIDDAQVELDKIRLSSDSSIISKMHQKGLLTSNDLDDSEKDHLASLDCVYLAPMKLHDILLGLISLGPSVDQTTYSTQDVKFLETVCTQVAIGIEHVRLREQHDEADTALDIQRRLIPSDMPVIQGYEMIGAWQPARAVSGDYFDIMPFSERAFGVLIADVVGKGMPAALLMSNVQAAVKSVAVEHMPPNELCRHVNRVMCDNIDDGKFVTFFYGLLDVEGRKLVYTNAGHNQPILIRADGRLERLETGGTVLGIMEDGLYQQGEVLLYPNDRIVMYTDGVTEIRNEADEEYGEDRLMELLLAHRSLDAVSMNRKVLEEITDFGSGEVQDDVTLLVLAVGEYNTV